MTIDTRGRSESDCDALWADLARFVTSPISWFGSAQRYRFRTSRGDDVVQVGGVPFGGVGERIYGSTGTDRYDFSGVLPRTVSLSIRNSVIGIP